MTAYCPIPAGLRATADLPGQAAVAHLSMDGEGLITFANEVFLSLTGYSAYDIMGCHHSAIIDLRSLRHICMDLGYDVGQVFHGQPGPIPLIGRNREIAWIYGAITPQTPGETLGGALGEAAGFTLIGHDFGETGNRLVDQTGIIRALNQHFLVAEFDIDGTLRAANASFLQAFNYTLGEILGTDHSRLVDPTFAATGEYAAFWNALHYGQSHPIRGLRYGKNQREVWLDAAYYPVPDARGIPCKVVLMGRDLTLKYRIEQEAAENARRAENIDAVTGLENRTAFRRSIQKYFNPINGSKAFPGLLVVFDINAFAACNTTYGHEAGDAILWIVGRRIRDALRRQDMTARIDRDLFAAFIETAPQEEEGQLPLVERILAAIATPIELGREQIVITASAGVVCGFGWQLARAAGTEDILACAQAALAATKQKGKGGYRLFDAELAQAARRRQMIERDLEAAMLSGEITLHYQPVVSLGSDGLVGYEALARWAHPTLGQIPPPEFIGVAEQSGAIHALGRALLEQAARFIAGRDRALWVAVNVSPLQLQHSDFSSQLRDMARRCGVPPHRIDIEITESASLDTSFNVQENIRALRDHGFSISLDDFGTGFSSLSQLLQLRADRIKIDQSFTRDCQDSQEKIGIIRSILGLSSAMGMKVVAEGIETPEISALLRELGCDYGQGYLFGRPSPPE
ncbi:MAG TPA: EAL domain-containing protein [Novosphingobium sp.]|nr:EAL domain-containing protein [Novosphingobium sp.]HZV11538.1 EAL domain-containing protein [Novosphingobium sp.]